MPAWPRHAGKRRSSPRSTTEAAAALRATMTESRLDRGRRPVLRGRAGDRLYVITDGKIKLGGASGDGRETLLAVLGPGEMFGELSLFDPGPRTATATALTDAHLLGARPRRPAALADAAGPRSPGPLLRALAQRLRRTNEAMADLVFSDVPGRVAKALLDLAATFGSRSRTTVVHVTHDLTQEELAQLVGASRETVNKALADFQNRGWLRLEPRASTVLDVDASPRRAPDTAALS